MGGERAAELRVPRRLSHLVIQAHGVGQGGISLERFKEVACRNQLLFYRASSAAHHHDHAQAFCTDRISCRAECVFWQVPTKRSAGSLTLGKVQTQQRTSRGKRRAEHRIVVAAAKMLLVDSPTSR